VKTRSFLLLLAFAAMLACSKPVEEQQAPAHEPEPIAPPVEQVAAESGNLLNMARGATVVSRTGEVALKSSAVQAIDGDPDTAWISPPLDTRQSLVFAFPARARIEQVGVQTPPVPHLQVKGALFEVSPDGRAFERLYEAKFDSQKSAQLVAVNPVEAKYLRVTTTDAPGRFARLDGVHARGSLLEKPVRGPIAGCWTVNGFAARFHDENGRITGAIEEHGVVSLEGGAEGLLHRFAWTRAGEVGVAAITVSDDGKHLAGMQWYVQPQVKYLATSWLGERTDCRDRAGPVDVAAAFIAEPQPFPLYARDADTIVRLLSQSPGRLRLVANEYRHDSPNENRRRAQAEIDVLRAALQKRGVDLSRIDFIASGSDRRRIQMTTEVKRALHSVVEIERP
jgi:hypothetical protein